MKYRYINLIAVVALALLATGCPKVRSVTGSGNCTVNNQGVRTCGVGVSVVINRGTAPTMGEESELIVDVPDGWTVNNSSSGSLNFKANSNSAQSDITAVPLTLSTFARDPIGKDSSTRVFTADETVIEAAKDSQSEDYESEFISQFTAEQTSCGIPSGDYIFHFRLKPEGEDKAAYLGSAKIVYQAGPGSSCEQSSAMVE